MATARSLVFTAGGLTQEAKDADTQLVSAILGNNSGSFTLNAAGTSLLLKVGGTTYLTVSSAAITAASGTVFSGDGSDLTNISNSSLNSGIDAIKISSGLISNTEFDYLDGVTSPIQNQLDGLGTIVNLLVNDGYTLFLSRTASDIVTYETLRSEPASGLEKIDTVTVTSGGGPVLLGAYATDPGVPGVGTLPSGMWGFREFASVSNTSGTSTILVRVYSRNTLGTETLLFESTSPAITSTSPTLYYWIYTQNVDVALDPTDRIVIKFYGKTTSVSSRNISHYYEGSTHASWLSTPMPAPIPVSGAQAQIVATPASQTGPVALRSLTTAYLPIGNTGSTVPLGNDARFNPSPSAAGRIIYDSGSAWQALAAGAAGQILQANGAGAPSWVDGQTTSGQTLWSTPASGEIGYQTSTAGTLAKCNATAIATCPNAVCVYQGTASTVTPLKDGQPIGILFESGLNSGGTGAPAAGQSVFVSAGTAGRATNNAPTGSGNVVLYLGEIKDLNGGYDNTLGSILNVWPRVGQPIVRN